MVKEMRTILMVMLLAFVFAVPAHAQDSTRLERYEYVIGGSAAFSLFDYIGYNLLKYNPTTTTVYRVLQGSVQLAISYFLYEKLGLPSAISFNLLWWSWVDDLGYYGWTNLFNPPSDALHTSDWENRTNSGLLDRQPYWAWGTPIGLLRPKYAPIARSALIAQAVIGFSVSMAILW
jgi:hypothetical protein